MVQVSLSGPKTPASKCSLEEDQNIAVFVRCRPLKSTEKKSVVEVLPDQKMVRVTDRGTLGSIPNSDKLYSRTFNFDAVFGQNAPQIEVYRLVVAPLIDQVIAGYNCTVFAYGQTGTGKTYTMEGERTSDEYSWEEDPLSGIIPRALHQLFETLPENTEYTVGVSFIELYNEELYDLLSPVDDTSKLKIYEDTNRKGSVIINGLEEINVHTKAQIYEILRKGSDKRQTAATLLNACSSRSHTIFSVTVHVKETSIDGEELLKIGKLNLVDLAGSENIGRSGASDKRAREAGNINQSLLTLGRVITSLTDKAPHIPYRESKLTRLLKDSLGGRTKTSIIATISPHVLDAEDTLSTLEYAQRAKKITNKPEVNQKLSIKTRLREYTTEIERLRRDLAACREKNGFFINEDNYNQLVEKVDSQAKHIEKKEFEIKELQEELKCITTLYEETQADLNIKTSSLQTTKKKLKLVENDLSDTENALREQKYLVDVHAQNEQLLYGQASQLLTIADTTTKDVENLQQKTERLKAIEETNFSKLEVFQKRFYEQFQHLEHIVEVGSDSLSECLSSVQPKIQEDFENVGKQLDKIIVALAKEVKIIGEFTCKFSETVECDKQCLSQMAEGKGKMKYFTEKRCECENRLKDEIKLSRQVIEEGLTNICQIMNLQRAQFEETLMKQNDHMEQFVVYRKQCFLNIKESFMKVLETQNLEIQSLKGQIELVKSDQSKFNDKKNAKISRLTQLLEKTSVVVHELRDLETKSLGKLDEDVITATSIIAQIEETMKDDKVKVSNVLDEISEGLGVRETCEFEFINELDCLNNRNVQNNTSEVYSLCSKVKSNLEGTEKFVNKANDEISAIEIEISKQYDNIVDTVAANSQTKQQVVDAMITSLRIADAEANCEVISTNLANTKDSLLKDLSIAQNETQKWHRSYKREITSRSGDFDVFKCSDLVSYQPTGNTPKRTDYRYPQQLVLTSPHDKLILRFREDKANSEVIVAVNSPLPDDEEVDEICDSQESIKSENSNIENQFSPLAITPKAGEKRLTNKNSFGEDKEKKGKDVRNKSNRHLMPVFDNKQENNI